ncbi:hypothetical protein [uncultured Rikenella sp.]|uniref:hypothetical protein n=1 Tax=uncultured Rikenella sp. TaxID=368003 RepID=UPI002623561E|nr:hypothetical protein [uncultured Rikenella sp.]
MKRLKLLVKLFWNLPQILIFNFHYLPLKQAIRLPVWLFNVKSNALKGKVVIKSDKVNPGMIRMGHMAIGPYRSTKGCFIWENQGIIEFCGSCSIGSHSAITVGGGGFGG